MTHTAHTQVLARVLLVLVFLSVLFAPVRYEGCDPFGSLMVSDSILTHGTVRLDAIGAQNTRLYGYNTDLHNGHYYYSFPLGTSIVSLPFVAVAKIFGLNMLYAEVPMQIIIASITCVLTLLLLMKLARIFFDPLPAVLISGVFWFGTSLSSVCGTALWSHNFAALFALLSIYLVIKKIVTEEQLSCWPLIAVVLFFAYLCRPTMALLVPFELLFIFSYNKKTAFKIASLLLLLLMCFVWWSSNELHQFLPDYYIPQRLGGDRFYEALYNNVLGPSRGFLVYSPFIIVAWACFKDSIRQVVLKKTWLLLGLAWPLLHLFTISRFHQWWGGWTPGPRLITDALPGLFLLTLHTWPTRWRLAKSKSSIVILSVACLFSIFVNFFHGLFSYQYMRSFYSEPNIDIYQEYLSDWRYPQFLFNKERRAARLLDLEIHTISFESKKATFIGWGKPIKWFRQSTINHPAIIFQLNKENHYRGDLLLRYNSVAPQAIRMLINGKPIAEFTTSAGVLAPDLLRSSYRVSFVKRFSCSPEIFKNGKNILAFELAKPNPSEKLGLMFSYLIIR